MTHRILLVGSLVVGLVFAAGVAAAQRGPDASADASRASAERDKGEQELRMAELRAELEAKLAAKETAREERKTDAPAEVQPPAAAPPAADLLPVPSTEIAGAAPASSSAPGFHAPTPEAAPDLVPEPQRVPRALPTTSFFAMPDVMAEKVVAFGAGGAAAPRGSPWTAPGAEVDGEGAPWWQSLLWGIPILGVSGAGAVVIARQQRRSRQVENAADPSVFDGVLLLRRKDADPVAVVAGSRMVPVESGDLHGILRNGQGAVARGAMDEAIAWFDQALRIAPALAIAHFCRGVCLAASGRMAEAYGALDAAVREAPEEMSYRVHFARAAVALGKHKEAMDALEAVATLAPELGPAMLDDPQLAGLRDHPRFLAICGAL